MNKLILKGTPTNPRIERSADLIEIVGVSFKNESLQWKVIQKIEKDLKINPLKKGVILLEGNLSCLDFIYVITSLFQRYKIKTVVGFNKKDKPLSEIAERMLEEFDNLTISEI